MSMRTKVLFAVLWPLFPVLIIWSMLQPSEEAS